jgi:hypothetical protein
MSHSTWSRMCLMAMLGLGLAVPAVMAESGKQREKHDDRLSVSVAFGRGLNTAQPGNPVNHVVLPKKVTVNQDGVVHFLVAGFHQVAVYTPGTKPQDIVVPETGTFINDAHNRFYLGINPAGGPGNTQATPENPIVTGSDTRSNAQNRIESVGFPAEEGVGTNMVASPKAEPGIYLVICTVRGHFLDGMYAFVEVKAEDEDEDD